MLACLCPMSKAIFCFFVFFFFFIITFVIFHLWFFTFVSNFLFLIFFSYFGSGGSSEGEKAKDFVATMKRAFDARTLDTEANAVNVVENKQTDRLVRRIAIPQHAYDLSTRPLD